jgi:hypothetical protein
LPVATPKGKKKKREDQLFSTGKKKRKAKYKICRIVVEKMSSRRRTRMPGLRNRPSIADNQRLLKATKKGALILLRFIRLYSLFVFSWFKRHQN